MRHFYIITNEQKDPELSLTRKVQDYISLKGGTCTYGLNRLLGQESYLPLNLAEISKRTECILSIGGDGALIRAARDALACQIPLIGINKGHVGYLCELDEDNILAALDQLLDDQYMVEKRMLLTGHCILNKKQSHPYFALNDVVIYRSGLLQMLDLIIYVNGEYLNTYSADGIIIATPTGSTAYNMSAGGPIVDPKAKLILITPICPHSMHSKSIVLGAKDEIVVEISSRRTEHDEKVDISFDGDQSLRMSVGDKIVISRAKENTQILKLNKLSFLETLRKKMQQYPC